MVASLDIKKASAFEPVKPIPQPLTEHQMHRARIYRIGAGLIGSLPLRLLQLIGTIVGSMIWLFSSKTSAVLRTNIKLVFPELTPSEQTLLARASSIETGKMIFENLYVWTQDHQKVLTHITQVRGISK